MTLSKTSIAVALTSVLALAACEPGPIGGNPNDPNANTRNGALIGAGTGAVIGALSKGDGNRAQGALAGAVAGGALGAGYGYSLDKQEADLRRQLDSDVIITNTGDRLIVTLPQDILFATDSTQVQAGMQNDLAALARNVNVYSNSTGQLRLKATPPASAYRKGIGLTFPSQRVDNGRQRERTRRRRDIFPLYCVYRRHCFAL